MATDRNEANVFILTVLLTGIFVGFAAIIWLGLRTFIFIDSLFHIWLLTGAFVFGAHYLFFRKWDRYLAEISGYSFFGWATIILAVLISLNYLFHDQPNTKTILLKEQTALFLLADDEITITVDDAELNNFPHMLSFSEDEIHGRQTGLQVVASRAYFTTANGLLGY
ncbi:MAG: hypothetical protein EOP53_17835, partial [Sphingobacteriales bacterium]